MNRLDVSGLVFNIPSVDWIVLELAPRKELGFPFLFKLNRRDFFGRVEVPELKRFPVRPKT